MPDRDIPPHLSGCGQNDRDCFRRFEEQFCKVIAPVHDKFNQFLAENHETPYPLGQFFETSPYLNLLLYPEPVKFIRRFPLDPAKFQYLEGCVRQEEPYTLPTFSKHRERPIVMADVDRTRSYSSTDFARWMALIGGVISPIALVLAYTVDGLLRPRRG